MVKSGFTLLEMLVVLAVLGVFTGIAVVSLRLDRPGPAEALLVELRSARYAAIRTGADVEWRDGDVRVRFRSDGSATFARIERAGRVIHVDPLTGVASFAPR